MSTAKHRPTAHEHLSAALADMQTLYLMLLDSGAPKRVVDRARVLVDVMRLRVMEHAAAPQMARALCLVEWAHHGGCPACGGYGPIFPRSKYVVGHEPSCTLDAALTAAGLSPEDREAVRTGAKSKPKPVPPGYECLRCGSYTTTTYCSSRCAGWTGR